MYIYVLIASFIFWGGFSKYSKQVYKTGLFMLFVLTAFRNTDLGGSDTYIYQQFFEMVPKLDGVIGFQAYGFSVGYTVLNSLVKQFTDEYVVFQMVYAAVSLFLLNKVIRKMEFGERENCIFLFSYFCFHFIWNNWIIYRQNLADLLFWYFIISLYKTEKKKCRKKFFFILAAMFVPALFHSSALANVILLPALLFIGKWKDEKKQLWIPGVSIGIYVLGNPLYQLLIDIMAAYVNPSYANYGATESNFINYILRLFFFTLFAWHYSAEQHPQRKLILDTTLMMVLIGSFNAVATTRMYEYFAIGLYSCMTFILHYFSEGSRRIAAVIYWGAMLFILCRYVVYFDNGLFMKYSFFF